MSVSDPTIFNISNFLSQEIWTDQISRQNPEGRQPNISPILKDFYRLKNFKAKILPFFPVRWHRFLQLVRFTETCLVLHVPFPAMAQALRLEIPKILPLLQQEEEFKKLSSIRICVTPSLDFGVLETDSSSEEAMIDK